MGNGTPVAGTGGDLTGGVETAAIVSNSGNVTLNATAGGALSDGNGDTIPFTQITTAATTLTSAHGSAGAGADQRHQLERGAHRSGHQAHRAGCEVDV